MSGNVLIVDDDPVVRHILGSVLKSAGYQAIHCVSGEQCLSLLREQLSTGTLPLLIFLDLQLGDMTGAQVIREIRRITEPEHLPVVLLSANTKDETLQMFPDLKADNYLEKPFPPQRVLELLEEVMRGKPQSS
jgi:DNA-binding response OmpR family regulator